jgi:hypothetical protein
MEVKKHLFHIGGFDETVVNRELDKRTKLGKEENTEKEFKSAYSS